MHQLSKCAVQLRQAKRRRNIFHSQKLSPEQRYEKLAIGLDIWSRLMRTHRRNRLVNGLLRWRLFALFQRRKQEAEYTLSNMGKHESRHSNVFSQRSARQNDPQRHQKIKAISQTLAAEKLARLVRYPRAS